MGKPLYGLLLGGVLGGFDGLTALISAPNDPAVQAGIVGIVIGSTFKGLLAGVATGFFAKRYNSLPLGMAFGLLIGGSLAFLVACMQGKYYLVITLPGALLGMIVGYATQKYGNPASHPSPPPLRDA